MLEKDGLPCLVLGLALTGLFTLSLFQLYLDLSSLAVLLGMNGLSNTAPKGERLIGQLLLLGWDDLGCDVERFDIDNSKLLLNRDRFLQQLISIMKDH